MKNKTYKKELIELLNNSDERVKNSIRWGYASNFTESGEPPSLKRVLDSLGPDHHKYIISIIHEMAAQRKKKLESLLKKSNSNSNSNKEQ